MFIYYQGVYLKIGPFLYLFLGLPGLISNSRKRKLRHTTGNLLLPHPILHQVSRGKGI